MCVPLSPAERARNGNANGGACAPQNNDAAAFDVPVEEFTTWGPDCGDMFFFPQGALNLLYSPADGNFSVKLKYLAFAPDGYCKRVSACSYGGAWCLIWFGLGGVVLGKGGCVQPLLTFNCT
jgi:hypothetical protein